MRSDHLELYKVHVQEIERRTRRALESAGFDSLAIHSGLPVKRSLFDDQYWPLRPVPHFQHWAHLPWPDCVLELPKAGRPRIVYARDRSFWERPTEPDWAALAAAFELVEVKDAAAIAGALGGGSGSLSARAAFVGESQPRAKELGFSAAQLNPAALMPLLDELRVHKTAYETACLREANRIACRGHRAVKDAFTSGERSELKLHLVYLEATAQDDPETPYKNIVAIGEHAAILHHVDYARLPKPTGGSLLLDAGATYLGYASDVTRTYAAPGGGEAGQLFADILDRMEKLQAEACAGVAVGRGYESLHDEAHRILGRVLTDTGLVKMSAEGAVETGVTRSFLPHGLGHSLGLQTHDVGCAKVKPRKDNPFLRNTRTIEPDQIFTIEPGIYWIDTFLDELRAGPHAGAIDWRRVDALRPFGGIRIEDDVRVLAPGSGGAAIENITRIEMEA